MVHEDDDFEPLRIRPYVNLPDPVPDAADDVVGAAYDTQPLAPVREEPRPPEYLTSDSAPPRRRRPLAVLAATVAALAVAGTAAFAGGLFSGDDSTDALPIAPTSAPPPEPTTAEPQPTTTASHSPSPTPSRPTPSATRTKSQAPPTPSPTRSTARATGTVQTPSATPTSNPPTSAAAAPVLSRGDSGPEVVELQKRLQQAWVYQGSTNGRFDNKVEDAVRMYQSWMGIEDDPSGVYGAHTRRVLEASTQEQ
ncbi:peptidoglycan-binding domain-containing protein [Streptomyces sp. NBC_01465]|uniref:peptidoglycan-binding domain-containing protein n=1 Tax=Streptomyces sp. NBC_01465 TaxID=2903878 RepID=UPI002E36D7E1|nr:peptidoglycan-binding domain-containing protein [Streptomyces sp. NBC_01465]